MNLRMKNSKNIGGATKLYLSSIKPVEHRSISIPEVVSRKKVLSIGCVDMINDVTLSEIIKNGEHQFFNISKKASDLIGVDINKEGIDRLKKLGLNAIYFDIVDDSVKKGTELDTHFDYVVVSHVIEHVPNHYEFLNKILEKFSFSKIIIAVPNALTRRNFFNFLFGFEKVSNDHYHTFTPVTFIRYIKSFGLFIDNIYYDCRKYSITLGKKRPIRGLLNNIFKKIFFSSKIGSIVVVATPNKDKHAEA